MSPASEPPYPPGGQAPPAALPGRRARALPAAPLPDGAGDEVDDATIPRSAIQRGASGGYQGQGGPQDPADWFGRTTSPQASEQGQLAPEVHHAVL